MKNIEKRLGKLENPGASMRYLPRAPPAYYRAPFKCNVYCIASFNATNKTIEPYELLNSNNSALLLKFTTMRIKHIDVYVTGTKYAIIGFEGHKTIQTNQSGNPLVEAWTSNSILEERFEVFPVGADGTVTAARITPPKDLRERDFAVTDKLTPLFNVSGDGGGSSGYCFVCVELTGFAHLAPSIAEMKYSMPRGDIGRRAAAATFLNLDHKTVRKPTSERAKEMANEKWHGLPCPK